MKKFLVPFLLLSVSLTGQMVPEDWEKDLQARHPKASMVDWVPGDGIYTVHFQVGDRKMKAIYSEEGEWQKSIKEVPLPEVPEAVRANVAPGYSITGASEVTAAKDRQGRYILRLEAAFDKKGKLLELKNEEVEKPE